MADFLDDKSRALPDPKPGRPLAIALGQPAAKTVGPEAGPAAGAAAGAKVIAKGRGKVADQILAIAFDRGVKVRSDADLAEVLAAVELDSEVPLQALAVVAEILNCVYRASGRPIPESQV